jgi:hypothetical protein
MAVAIVSRSKGKIPRITFGAAQPINLSDDNWQTIEAAYGQSISQEIRTQINTATTRFLQLAVAEDTGLMNDAVQRANRLRRSADSLLAAIDQRDIGDVTRGYVDDELELSYRMLSRDKARFARTYIDDFTVKLSWFLSACKLTAQRICDASQNNYWPNGGAWEVWVQHLAGILSAHGLPTGARKDVDKTKFERASPFVEFVRSLQTFLPKKHIRAYHSKGALANAINKARKASRIAQ